MKSIFACFIALFVMFASAQTVILYDDGSQYTVQDNEKVYVSHYSKLYYTKAYSRGDILFHLTLPNTKKDHVYVETGGVGVIGSAQWCESYIPWSEGLTFDMIAWQQVCDVTNDGVYDMCDYYEPTGILSFEELQWQDQCNGGEAYSGD